MDAGQIVVGAVALLAGILFAGADVDANHVHDQSVPVVAVPYASGQSTGTVNNFSQHFVDQDDFDAGLENNFLKTSLFSVISIVFAVIFLGALLTYVITSAKRDIKEHHDPIQQALLRSNDAKDAAIIRNQDQDNFADHTAQTDQNTLRAAEAGARMANSPVQSGT